MTDVAWHELPTDEDQRRFLREAVHGTEVHTVHVEVEGRSKLPLFSRILDAWIAGGVAFVTLEDLAHEALTRKAEIPTRPLTRARLRGRGARSRPVGSTREKHR